MSVAIARRLLVTQVLLLMIGTQMPGAWREVALSVVEAPSALSSWAHFTLFGGMAMVAHARPLAAGAVRVLVLLVALALISEGMQAFAIDRHPRWIDVCIDISGALVGISIAAVANFFVKTSAQV